MDATGRRFWRVAAVAAAASAFVAPGPAACRPSTVRRVIEESERVAAGDLSGADESMLYNVKGPKKSGDEEGLPWWLSLIHI